MSDSNAQSSTTTVDDFFAQFRDQGASVAMEEAELRAERDKIDAECAEIEAGTDSDEPERVADYTEPLMAGFGTPEPCSGAHCKANCGPPRKKPPKYIPKGGKKPDPTTGKNEKVIDVEKIKGFRGDDTVDDLLKYIEGGPSGLSQSVTGAKKSGKKNKKKK